MFAWLWPAVVRSVTFVMDTACTHIVLLSEMIGLGTGLGTEPVHTGSTNGIGSVLVLDEEQPVLQALSHLHKLHYKASFINATDLVAPPV